MEAIEALEARLAGAEGRESEWAKHAGKSDAQIVDLTSELAVVERALKPLYEAALHAVCYVGIDGGNKQVDADAIHALDETLDAARAAIAQEPRK